MFGCGAAALGVCGEQGFRIFRRGGAGNAEEDGFYLKSFLTLCPQRLCGESGLLISPPSRGVRNNRFARRKRRNMDIQIEPHMLERAEERGSNEEEIRDVINTGLL
jgi:hypothetical protein